MSGVAEAGTLAFFREARFEPDFTAQHLFLHLALIRDHYRLWRHGIELHNSGDNDDHDQQRIHCAYSDSDANTNPCAYTKSDSYANANTDPNADTRYSDDYVRR